MRAPIPDGVIARHLAGVCLGRRAEDVRERDRLAGRRVVQKHTPSASAEPLAAKQDPVPGNRRMPLPPTRIDPHWNRLHVRNNVPQPEIGVAPADPLIHMRCAIDAAGPGMMPGVHLERRLARTALDEQPRRVPTRPGEVCPSARSRHLLECRSRLDGDLGRGVSRPRRGQEHHRDRSPATTELTSSCAHQSSPNEAQPYHFARFVTSADARAWALLPAVSAPYRLAPR